jgi:hypothetical protein
LLECLIIPLLSFLLEGLIYSFLPPSFLEGVQSITINRVSHINFFSSFSFFLNSWLILWLYSLYSDSFQYFFAWLPPPVSVVLHFFFMLVEIAYSNNFQTCAGCTSKTSPERTNTHVSKASLSSCKECGLWFGSPTFKGNCPQRCEEQQRAHWSRFYRGPWWWTSCEIVWLW